MRISDWSSDVCSSDLSRLAGGVEFLKQAKASPAKSGPSLSLASYAGRYRGPWYGDVVIGSDKKGLTIDFPSTPRMAGRLDHWQYDSFVTKFEDRKSVVSGKRVSGRVVLGGRRIIKKKTKK